MTTATLTVIDVKRKKQKTYWVWQDGYRVDRMLKEAQKRNKENYGKELKEFTMETLESQILSDKENNFAIAWLDEAGDWHWNLVILDKHHVVLTGAGSKIKTSYLEI